MSDLISRQAAIDLWEKYHYTIAVDAIRYDAELRQLPSAQLGIIHCKDCTSWCEQYSCKVVFHPTNADDTCVTVLGAKRKEVKK